MHQTDAGWSWVVLAASSGCNFLNGVLCYFVGVVHTGLLARFHSSVTTTAWVGALYSANMCITAPIAGLVINKFGCRVCCVLGGLLCFAGFTASAFVPSIAWLFVTYGFIAGLGLGLTYSPTIITIGYYFDKYRGMASGLSVAFAAIGILSGSLIAQALIDYYSVSGAFLLIGAISCHFCILGMFYRPTDFEKKDMQGNAVEVPNPEMQNSVLDTRASRLSLAMHGIELRASSHSSVHKDHNFPRLGYGSVTSLLRRAQLNRSRQTIGNASLSASMRSGEFLSVRHRHDVNCGKMLMGEVVSIECEEYVGGERTRVTPASLDIPNKCFCGVHALLDCDQTPDTGLSVSVQSLRHPGISLEQINENNIPHKSTSVTKPASLSETVTHNGTIHTLTDSQNSEVPGSNPLHSNTNDVTAPHTHNHTSHDIAAPHTPLQHLRYITEQHQMNGKEDYGSHCLLPRHDDMHSVTSRDGRGKLSGPSGRGGSRTLKTKVLQTVDSYLAVLTDKPFMMHCVSVLMANLHTSGIYLHLPEYVQTKGTSPTQAAALFIAVGIFSLVSRVCTGFATMDPKIDPLTLNMGMMGLCGIGTAFFPLYSGSYTGQLVYSAIFGLYTGGLYALVSVLTVQFMGLSKLPTAFGVMVFLMGIGYVVGPPLAALIVDRGGTYQESFIFLGSVMMVGAMFDLAAGFFSQSREVPEEEVEIASINRDWLGSSIIISFQDTGSAHVHYDPGSLPSVPSPLSQDLNS